MITWRGAKSLRISDYGLEEGNRADIIVLDAPIVHHALRMQSERLYVIKGGKLVAENQVTRKVQIVRRQDSIIKRGQEFSCLLKAMLNMLKA